MNTRINPVLAIAIVLLFGSILALQFWAGGKALEYEGPNHLHVDTTGNLYIQIGETLLKYDASGRLFNQYDLKEMGVEQMIGDFALFNNGDLLIRRGQYNPGLLENIRRYLRHTNTSPQEAPDDETGLFRCNLNTRICARFGDGSIDLNNAFHLFMDPNTEEVYASDTSRHVLRKFNQLGEQLSSIKEGFFFPNQILLQDKLLYVADTNHHQIHIVETGIENFGQTRATHDIRTIAETAEDLRTQQILSGHTWPTALLPVGDHWWVNNMTHEMRNGGIYIYDQQWQMTGRLALPDDADPVSLTRFNNSILISDMSLNRIYRFDLTGQQQEDFTSKALATITDDNVAQQSWYQDLADYALYTFIGLLVAGFAIALTLSARQASSGTASRTRRDRTVARATSEIHNSDHEPDSITEIPFHFTGNAREFFGIWVVNILLTIITLGIYSPWAKVRTKRYFFGNTSLDNSPFDYLADPIAILKGWAIGLGIFALYSVLTKLMPLMSVIFMLLFFLLLPWLVIRSLAFRMHNTSYRNLRFRFNRKYGEAIKIFVGIGVLVPLTLGLIFPSYIFRQKKFIVDNSFYGTTGFDFRALEIKFYEIYGIAILILMAGGITFTLLVPALSMLAGGSLPGLAVLGAAGQDPEAKAPVILPILMLIGTGGFYLFAFAYINTKIHNLVWNNTHIASHAFRSTLAVKHMAWLYFSNALAIMFSFGLMIPWARIRMARYRINNLALAVSGSLDNFIATEAEQVNAAGEEIGEVFDFDIGL